MTIEVKTILLVLLMAMVPGLGTWPQDALSLSTARLLSLTKSAVLQKAEISISAATLAVRAQSYAFLPQLSASASGSYDLRQNFPAASAEMHLDANMTIFDGGRSAGLSEKLGFEVESAIDDLFATRLALIGQADVVFFASLAADSAVDAAVGDLDAASHRLDIAQRRIEAGSLSKADYLILESEKADCQTALVQAQMTLGAAKDRLASLTRTPVSSTLKWENRAANDALIKRLGALDKTAIESITDAVEALALDRSPHIALLDLLGSQAKLAGRLARTAFMPTLSAGYTQSFSFNGIAGLATKGSFSLATSWGLNFWMVKDGIKAADIFSEQAVLDTSQGQNDLKLEIRLAFGELLSASRATASATRAASYAEGNYAGELEKFTYSEGTVSNLLTSWALVSTERAALVSLRNGFLTALSTLRGLAGLEDDTLILKLVFMTPPAL